MMFRYQTRTDSARSKKGESASCHSESHSSRAARRETGVARETADDVARDIVALTEEEYAHLEACTKSPQQPTSSILEGAALIERLYSKHS
jgi:hypothetical protein